MSGNPGGGRRGPPWALRAQVEVLAPLDVPPGCLTSQAEAIWDGRVLPGLLMALV